MAQGTPQTEVYSPKFTIDCVLANVSTQLQADGCVLESVKEGHKLITPGHLRVGDTVTVQFMVGRRGGLYRHPAGGSYMGSHALDHGGSDRGEPK